MIVWVDLETTGLDYAVDEILEIGMYATDDQLRKLNGMSVVLGITPRGLGLVNGDPFVKQMHTDNLLLGELGDPIEDVRVAEIEDEFLKWLGSLRDWPSNDGVEPGTVPMGGSNPQFDRNFLRRFMPRVEAWFHYRNVDISAVKELAERWAPDVAKYRPTGEKNHRVMSDIDDTIAEAGFYRSVIFGEGGHRC